MHFLSRRLIASFLLGGFALTVVSIPAWSAASASGSTTQPTPAASDSTAAVRDTVRATEAAARFFDPLLAEVKTPAERASLLHQRGVLYLRSFMQEKALADLNEAAHLLPSEDAERSDVLFHRACALLLPAHANPSAALADITACLPDRPEDAEVLLIRAVAYRLRGENDKADADLAHANALAPKEDAAMHALLQRIQNKTP